MMDIKKLKKREFNKLLQSLSLLMKLHSLVCGCYSWSRKSKKFVITKDFQEKFDAVIKTSRLLVKYKPANIISELMASMDYRKE